MEGVGGTFSGQKPAENVVSNMLALEVSKAGLPSMGDAAGQVQTGSGTALRVS